MKEQNKSLQQVNNEYNQLKVQNERQQQLIRDLRTEKESQYDCNGDEKQSNNTKDMKEFIRKYTGHCTTPFGHRSYGYLLVDDTKETIRLYQNDLPYGYLLLEGGDRFEFNIQNAASPSHYRTAKNVKSMMTNTGLTTKMKIIMDQLQNENDSLKCEKIQLQQRFNQYKQKTNLCMTQNKTNYENENQKLQFIIQDLEQQLNEYDEEKEYLLNQLNIYDQQRADWEVKYRMIKDKYEPQMQQYKEWAQTDRFKCCECNKIKHKRHFSKYQLERWSIHKKRCKPCESRLSYKRYSSNKIRAKRYKYQQNEIRYQTQIVSKPNRSDVEKRKERHNGHRSESNNINYESWKAQDIVNWVVNLDKDRFNKYCYTLLNNMVQQEIDGIKLLKLTMNDLNNLGITAPEDQEDLLEYIQTLM